MSTKRNEGRLRGLGAWWASGAIAVFTCLIMVSSTAAGGTVPATVTYHAPYHHALVTPYNDITELSGCGKISGKPAVFSASTGFGHWTGAARASTCTGPAGKASPASYALIQDAVQVSLPVHVPLGSAVTTTFNVTWNLTAMGNYSLVYSGKCPNAVYNASRGYGYSQCVAEAISQVIVDATLVDMTTGVVTYPSFFTNGPYAYNFVDNYSYCYNATSCSYYNSSAHTALSAFSGTTLLHYGITAVTNSADRYAIATYIGGDVVMEMQTYTGVATGYINMGTLGNGYQLVSIVET
ncbi:MAG: hypothetical protein L3K19_01950 [Thermoplasmata archaeon]|nr:hypothetical protein [Thermoplasmata archaeon]